MSRVSLSKTATRLLGGAGLLAALFPFSLPLLGGTPVGVIDFEPDNKGILPDGSAPRDEAVLFDQYLRSHGVTFGIDSDGDGLADGGRQPSLERVGGLDWEDGFRNDRLRTADRPASGFESALGGWFMDLDWDGTPPALLITYASPVLGASGQVWDIDGTSRYSYESWRVEGLSQDRSVVAAVDSPRGYSLELDGQPWEWRLFAPTGASIHAIRIGYRGTKYDIGLAFDRFSPSIPTPTVTPTASPTASSTDASPVRTASHTPTDPGDATATPTSDTVTATPTSDTGTTTPGSETVTATPASETVTQSATFDALTATPTAGTPSAARQRAFLPVALNERNQSWRIPADVALVIDTSSSMEGDKLRSAQIAAVDFVRLLDLSADRVAVVAFDAEARLTLPLSRNGALLEQAILSLTPSPGTRIDLGLEVALGALRAAPPSGVAGEPVVVLLSDGIQEVDPERAERLAADARAEGIAIYTIGLGTEVDQAFLETLAGAPDRYFFAPTPDDLRAIYRKVARVIPCRPDDFWGGRC